MIWEKTQLNIVLMQALRKSQPVRSSKKSSSAITEVKEMFRCSQPEVGAMLKSVMNPKIKDQVRLKKCSIDRVCALTTNASQKFIRSNKKEKNCAQSLTSFRRISKLCTIEKLDILKILSQFSTSLKGIRT